MYKQNKQLVGLIKPVVEAMGYGLLGIEYVKQGRYSLLRLYIDKEGGIDLTDCEKVSHQVTGTLDVEDPIQGAYNLEVSSPGMDRPLFTLEQFKRHKGEKVKLLLASMLEGRRKFSGRIIDVEKNHVVIEAEGNQIEIPADAIQQARIVPAELDFKNAESKRET
jgi:ribosome maturation factor RimP